MPFRTTVHDVAHILLGQTGEGEPSDSEVTPRNLREGEAHTVAMLCCAALNACGSRRFARNIQNKMGVRRDGRVVDGGGLENRADRSARIANFRLHHARYAR